MARSKLLWLWLALPLATAPRAAEPPPITAENAGRVERLREVPKVVNKILRGANPGEMILMQFGGSAEVVDAELRPLRALAGPQRPDDVAFLPGGHPLAWNDVGKTSYTVRTSADAQPFEIEIGAHAGNAAFHPDGQLIAIGFTYWDPSAHGAGHSETRLYDLAGKLVKTLERTGPGALDPVFSPNGKILAVGNRNDNTQLFDVETGKLRHRLAKRMTQDIAFRPDGLVLAEGCVDGTVATYDVATGALLHAKPSGCNELYAVDWNPTGDVLATSGREGEILLWNPAGLEKIKALGSQPWVAEAIFTADGRRLLTAGAEGDTANAGDRKVIIWAVPEKN